MHLPVVVFEARPPVGCSQQRLQRAGQVDEPVAHKEEHGDDGGDLVQVAYQDSHLRDDCQSQNQRALLRGGGSGSLNEASYTGIILTVKCYNAEVLKDGLSMG